MLAAALKASNPHKFTDKFIHPAGLPNINASPPSAAVVYTDTIAKLVIESSFLSKVFIAMVYIAQVIAKPNVRMMPIMDALVEKSCLKTVTPTIPIIAIKKDAQET